VLAVLVVLVVLVMLVHVAGKEWRREEGEGDGGESSKKLVCASNAHA
jgi:hypothetical protein